MITRPRYLEVLTLIIGIAIAAPVVAQCWYPEMTLDGPCWGPSPSSAWQHETPPIRTDNWLELTLTNVYLNHSDMWQLPCTDVFDLDNTADHWSRHLLANDCFSSPAPIITGRGFGGSAMIEFTGPPPTIEQRNAGVAWPEQWYIDFEIDWIGRYLSPCYSANVGDTFRLHISASSRRFIQNRWVRNNGITLFAIEPYRQGFSENHSGIASDYFQPGQTFTVRFLPTSVLITEPDGSWREEWTFAQSLGGWMSGFDLSSLRSIQTYATVRVDRVDGARADFTLRISSPITAADLNGDGAVEVADLMVFLGAWFAGDARADWSGDAVCSIEDIFAYLTDFFGSV